MRVLASDEMVLERIGHQVIVLRDGTGTYRPGSIVVGKMLMEWINKNPLAPYRYV